MRQEEKVMNLEELKVVDADVAAAIEAEMDRQNSHIELIASENWVSDAVMDCLLYTSQFVVRQIMRCLL